MNLLKYWPTEKESLACIKPEAENPSDAVFLAVHQQMRFVRYNFKPDSQEKSDPQPLTENDLLREFLRDDPSGRVILPILGESGIGKSHLVRWLDVQLRQRTDHDKRHVIRIPKSSSLKSVLGRILEGLRGPRYEKIRRQLQSAREQMDSITARQRVRAELLAALQKKYLAASEKKARANTSGQSLSEQDRLWHAHAEPRSLPALLDDPATQKLFLQGITGRPGIIAELARHVTQDSREGDLPRRQFEAADFQIPTALADQLSEAGPIAKAYLERLLRTTNSKSLEDAVRLLNDIVDDAIAPLATPADTSLSELFYEVRRHLLADGRELVLLVEDFAVLAGIQKALLDAIIREGETGGKAEACMIRTALAVTDGYFNNLETTVRTRAIYGWWIEATDDKSEESTFDRIGNFIAAYLNAARIGVDKLSTHYTDPQNITKPPPRAIDFIEPMEGELELLAAFGESATNSSLFPFNKALIRQLANWKLRSTEKELRFHPRSIINEMILPVIKNHRSDFENKTFPPHPFLGYDKKKFDAELHRELTRLAPDVELRSRYQSFLHFWGGGPKRTGEAKIPAGVYQAFGLQLLDGAAKAIKPEALQSTIKVDSEKSSGVTQSSNEDLAAVQQSSVEPESIRDLIERLNDWRAGTELGQKDANRIRGLVGLKLLHSINWEALLLRPLRTEAEKGAWQRTYLPNARGNDFEIKDAFVVVATSEAFQTPAIADGVFFAVRAMIRHEHHGGWDYPQSEADYAAVANFIDAHLDAAIDGIRARYQNVEGDTVPALTQALLWQARLLNVESAHRADDASLVAAVFATSVPEQARDPNEEWSSFLDGLASNRPVLQSELLERITAWQGTGGIAHAVNAAQLIEPIRELKSSWKITCSFPQLPSNASDGQRQAASHIQMIMRGGQRAIEDRQKEITKQSQAILNDLGPNFDKNQLLKDLGEVCALVEQQGLTGEISVGQIRKLMETFQAARVKEVSKQVEEICGSQELGNTMSALARLDLGAQSFLLDFTAKCSKFLRERSGQAKNRIIEWSEEVVESKQREVDSILQELELAATPMPGVNR
jgi:hypothetical protein